MICKKRHHYIIKIALNALGPGPPRDGATHETFESVEVSCEVLLQSWELAEKALWQGPDQAAIPNRPATKVA